VRSDVRGPSSGISIALEDWRAEDARVDLSVPVLDLRVTEAVDVRVERDAVRPGMIVTWAVYDVVVWCRFWWLVCRPSLFTNTQPAEAPPHVK
jgi:hypothetical protein